MPLTITSTTTEFISLDEVRKQANIPATASADTLDELDLMRSAAQDAVEGLIGPVLWRTVTETVRPSASGSVWLTQGPVVSITSLTSRYYASNVAYRGLDATTGEIWCVRMYGPMTAVYIAGRTVAPDAAREAALLTAAHMWETQRGIAPTPLQDQESAGAQFVPFGGEAVPPRAYALLQAAGLLRPPVAA